MDWEPVIARLRQENAKDLTPAAPSSRRFKLGPGGLVLLTGAGFLFLSMVGPSFFRLGFNRGEFLLLMAVITFHELGHWYAAKWAGFRNLKMFYIPFFGAAVHGNVEGVPGWKRAIMILAGPMPGLALALPVGFTYAVTRWEPLMNLCAMLAAMNLINLLPIPILDGGRVLHMAFFSRRWWLEIAFYGVGVVCSLAVGLWLPESFFIILGVVGGILLLVVGRHTAQIGRIVDRLRRVEFGPVPPQTSELTLTQLDLMAAHAGNLLKDPEKDLDDTVTWVGLIHSRLREAPLSAKASTWLMATYAAGWMLGIASYHVTHG